MDLIYQYVEHLKEYSVEENEYCYYMPYTYILHLREYFKEVKAGEETPVENWYLTLKEIEKRIVSKKSRDEERLSSIW